MVKQQTRYRQVQDYLKKQIQLGTIDVGALLPSENELCRQFSITRTTARKALEELQKEGFIERQHGKGSIVVERRLSLGLLNVKGFSEAVGRNVETVFLKSPQMSKWPDNLVFKPEEQVNKTSCIYFKRLRCVDKVPVMLEKTWFSGEALKDFVESEFVEGSFFKTLSQKYLIEIKGSEQEIRAEYALGETSEVLQLRENAPILHISVKFVTSNPKLTIYSELYCDTKNYPIGNKYNL